MEMLPSILKLSCTKFSLTNFVMTPAYWRLLTSLQVGCASQWASGSAPCSRQQALQFELVMTGVSDVPAGQQMAWH